MIYQIHGTLSAIGYHRGGEAASEYIRAVLEEAGVRFTHETRILDFGCGAGSVLRWWRSGAFLQGCDYNPKLVAWCAANLPGVPISLNGAEPPTSYPAAEFDALYALSVMTHLRPDLQAAWMKEWARIVRPGGIILASFAGRSHLPPDLSPEKLDRAGHLIAWADRSGSNLCAVWNSEDDVVGRIAPDLNLLSSRVGSASTSDQDIYVFRVQQNGVA